MNSILGIMTTKSANHFPFPEHNYYSEIAKKAKQENLQVIVFFPESISFSKKRISGFSYEDGRWIEKSTPFPSLVYDRVFYNALYYQKNKVTVAQFKQDPNVCFLNRGLPSKWDLYLLLKESSELLPFLPAQELYQNETQLKIWLQREKNIILKPIAGGFGKRVLHVSWETPILLEGRNAKNQYFRKTYTNQQEAFSYLKNHLNQRYLIQKYLNLSTPNGHPYDIRVFVQKDHTGKWQYIGKGVRIGPRNKLTSNLHGGGTARTFQTFIQEIHPHKADRIEEKIDTLAKLVPPIIEQKYSPLFELGMDIGIDQQGNVWILEVNAKPGRQIFQVIKDKKAFEKVLKGPIEYARFLLKENKEGSDVD